MKPLVAGGIALAALMVLLLMAPFAMYITALTLAPTVVQAQAAADVSPASADQLISATPPDGGQDPGQSAGPLIAKLPRPPHIPWRSIEISPFLPLFRDTPAGGFSPGGLPYGQCTWYVAIQRGVVAHADGKDWVANLAARHFKTSRQPTVGAILSWRGYAPDYGFYGHVALVVDVDPDGKGFTVAEANVLGEGRADVRWVPIKNAGIVGFVP